MASAIFNEETMTMSEKFEAWGLVELMGHQRTAGRISEEQVGGANLLRVDVPIDAENYRTTYYGSSAIYALHVTDEATARALAGRMDKRPAYAYALETSSPRLSAAGAFEDDDRDGSDL
jgi:hypothetical protein